ncbi:MAG: DUF86 domain-containing protein [Prevotellaceae bacterium]|jgi:uncharacterized protein YutE (UPF0331/DUF86 family)|nr:DUF86 domain-containing protein [Prevotellaceae bacterium]
MKYNEIVEKNLLFIDKEVSLLESWKITSFAMLQQNTMLQKATERVLQVAIEAVIDTCERILALEKQPPADTSADMVKKVQELGVISGSPDYTEMVKFRNFIVHRHEEIDLEIVYAIVKKMLPLFREFIHDIRNTRNA